MNPAPAPKTPLSPLALVLILSGIFFAIFLTLSGLMYAFKTPGSGRSHTAASSIFGGGSIGVIELTGVIMDSKKVVGRLQRFDEDDQIKAVVLHLNSPGGSVAPSQEIYEAVRRFKKPLVASMGSVAASGAFYVACGAKKVYANPGTITGSIGVIMEFANLSKLYEWAKIQRYVIKTGKFKDAGSDFRPMEPDEKALLQGMVDDVLSQFKNAVATGRHLPPEQVTAIADGRIFSGSQAKRAKLVDELGTFQDAVDDAAKQANIKGKPTLVYPDRGRKKLLDLLLEDSGKEDSSEDSLDESGQMAGSASGVVGGLLGQAASQVAREVVGAIRPPSVAEMVPGIYWLWNGSH